MFRLDYLRRVFLCTLIVISSFSAAAEKTTGSTLMLESVMAMAVENNPNLAQMLARSKAMAAIPSQAGTLPDPVISFNALNLPVDTFDTAQEAMTQLQVGISQSIPFPGKLSLREEAATFDADAATHSVTETRWRLLSHVKTTWWLIFYLDRAIQIVDSNQTLLRQFVEIARIKYEVGEGLQQDVLLAQLELSKLLDQQLRLKGMRRNAAARLNALLDRAANHPVQLPDTVDQLLPAIVSETVLYEQAKASRALLAGQQKSINAAQSRLKLAKKDYYPDFKLGAFYGVRSGDNLPAVGGERADFLSLKLSMNVPIFAGRKQTKAVDQRHSELMQQKYALQDEWNEVRSQITQYASDYHRAKDQFILFETGIIPQAHQTVASMLAGYQFNKVDFLNLIRSQITLFNYETQYWKALAEANQALAKLTAAVGKEEIYE